MLGRQDQHSLTIDKYCSFNDVRPPKDRLQEFADRFSTSSRLSTIRVGADVLFDLAIADPANAEAHLEKAGLALDFIIQGVEDLYDQGCIREADTGCEYAAQAVLREFEIPRWLAASQGEAPVFDYIGGINAAARAVDDYTETKEGYAKVIEFLPVLLLERGARRGITPRHMGRMALFREDYGLEKGGLSYNWDCGFSAPNGRDAQQFTDASHKLQVKLGKTRASSYAPHIAVVGARNFHFADAKKILETCIQEEGLESLYDVEPFREGQINHLTKGIHDILLNPSKAGHPFRMI